MNRRKIYIAAAVFVLLTVIKFAFPQVGEGIRREAERILDYEPDYRQVFLDLRARFDADEPPELTAPPATESGRSLRAVEAGHAEAIRPVFLEGDCAGESLKPEQPEAVTVFLQSQSEFSDMELPESVSYDYVKLPFDYCVPVSGYSSSGFGYRMHPILNYVKFHYGTDIAANSGEDVLAFAGGTVTKAEYSESFGNFITIDHGDGWQTLYAHCSRLLVNVGDSVSAGDKIALVGATGQVTGPHLHLELTDNGKYYNPEYYING